MLADTINKSHFDWQQDGNVGIYIGPDFGATVDGPFAPLYFGEGKFGFYVRDEKGRDTAFVLSHERFVQDQEIHFFYRTLNIDGCVTQEVAIPVKFCQL